jgi:5-methylthioadenosine/S-adenosylhomocysteine deaminase
MGVLAIVPKLIIVNEEKVLKDSCIIVEDGKIGKIDKAERFRDYKPEFVIEGKRLGAMPCLVNAHTHVSERLLSGLGDGLKLFDWLKEVVWPHGLKLEGEDVYYIGKLFSMEAMVSGIGVFNDMFVHNGSSFILDKLAESVAESGLKALLGRGINERNGDAQAAMKDTLQAIEKWHGYKGRIFITLAPTLIHANSEETLLKIRELAYLRKLRIHIHVAETIDEYRWIKQNLYMTPVEYLDRLGFLGSDVMAAHLVWLGINDIKILKENGVAGIHNPLSNMRLADGVSPVWAMIKAGIPLGLGTDGSASSDNQDLFAAMRLATFMPRAFKLNVEAISSKDVFAMATRMGYKILGLEGGEIREGGPADITLIDLYHPSFFPPNDVVTQIVLSSHPGIVKGVIVDGKVLYYDGRFSTLDQEDIILKIQEIVEKMRSVK